MSAGDVVLVKSIASKKKNTANQHGLSKKKPVLFLWWVDGVFIWKEQTSSQWWINGWDRQGGAQKESSWTTQCLEDDPFPTPRIFSNLSWCKTKKVWQKRKKSLKQKTPKFHICSSIHLEIPKQAQCFWSTLPLACWPPWDSGCSAGRWSATICNRLAGHTFREGAEI